MCGINDTGNWFEGGLVPIANEWQAVELEWKAATAPGANDGYARLYIDGVLASEIANINNDTQVIDDISFGVEEIPSGASGTLYFDAFESRSGGTIGPLASLPSAQPVAYRAKRVWLIWFTSRIQPIRRPPRRPPLRRSHIRLRRRQSAGFSHE